MSDMMKRSSNGGKGREIKVGDVSASHVSLVPANPVALEQPPSGTWDDGDTQMAAYGNTHTHLQTDLTL